MDGAVEGGDMDRDEGAVEGGVSSEEGVSDWDMMLVSLTDSADEDCSLGCLSLG